MLSLAQRRADALPDHCDGVKRRSATDAAAQPPISVASWFGETLWGQLWCVDWDITVWENGVQDSIAGVYGHSLHTYDNKTSVTTGIIQKWRP